MSGLTPPGSFFRSGPACERYALFRDRTDAVTVAVGEMIEEMWAKCWAYVDPRLPANALNDFFPAFWELDLANSMLENGVALVEKTRSKGPDIVCRSTPNVYVEAIVATPGDPSHPDSVPSILNDVTWDVPHDQFILRLRNAIEVKTGKRNEYLEKGILADTDPYVIAINSAPIDSSRLEMAVPDILRAVLPFGDEYVTIDLPTGDAVGGGFHHRPVIFKTKRPPDDPAATAASDADRPSGSGPEVPPEKSPVSTTVFQSPEYDGVSAVLFSCCDEVNRPNLPGAELTLIRNPRATKNPVPENFFGFGREYVIHAGDRSVERLYRSPESHPRFAHLFP
jgi:hypothetical protein